MQNRDYTFCFGSIKNEGPSYNGVSSSRIWKKLKNETESTMDTVKELGSQGWELVAVTPIAAWSEKSLAGVTSKVLFTFKKPID